MEHLITLFCDVFLLKLSVRVKSRLSVSPKTSCSCLLPRSKSSFWTFYLPRSEVLPLFLEWKEAPPDALQWHPGQTEFLPYYNGILQESDVPVFFLPHGGGFFLCIEAPCRCHEAGRSCTTVPCPETVRVPGHKSSQYGQQKADVPSYDRSKSGPVPGVR